MKNETRVFGYGIPFFFVSAFVYAFMTGWKEWLGFIGLLMTGLLSLLIAFYLNYTGRHVDPRPEDDEYGEIHENAGELGTFAPQSWWPLPLGLGAAISFAGLAVGFWLVYIGVAFSVIALVGWVFEFYRGEHAH
jgi:putative Mn2+ efflux pump MntP